MIGITHKLHAFTLAEVIVALALTSMAIMFAYGTLTYVQKLFMNYKDQNRFIQEYSTFKERMDHEALYSEWVIQKNENTLSIKRDSSVISVEFLKNVILMKSEEACDTFHLTALDINKEYEEMHDQDMTNKLVKTLKFDVKFSRQKFSFYFYKQYDAFVKLKLDKIE